MDIPSIKFRYFEKLKLWHDYLSSSSVFEKEKIKYWKHEKMILHWAYTNKHKHLFTALSNRRILEAYGINKDNPEEKDKISELEDINTELNVRDLIRELQKNIGKINYFMGNLVVEGLFDCVGIVKKENCELYPERIRVNKKGLLIGEILNEAHYNPTFINKNFRKYRFGYWGLNMLIFIASVSLLFALFNQLAQFWGKIFSDVPQKNGIHRNYNNFSGIKEKSELAKSDQSVVSEALLKTSTESEISNKKDYHSNPEEYGGEVLQLRGEGSKIHQVTAHLLTEHGYLTPPEDWIKVSFNTPVDLMDINCRAGYKINSCVAKEESFIDNKLGCRTTLGEQIKNIVSVTCIKE